jgi:hypothetical protein
MRHLVAIAELMGLPKASQAVELNRIKGAAYDESPVQKAQLWESICAADRLLGMIINLPSATRRYQLAVPSNLTIDGVVQARAYVSRLSAITINVQDLDDMNTSQQSESEMYATALKIDKELKELASQTPESWWTIEKNPIEAAHVLQFLHSAITMRAHLPLVMRQNPSPEFIYSRVACMDACEAVASRYQFLRQQFPTGIFLARIMDLQVFTAIVVILLTSHNSPSLYHPNIRKTRTQIENQVKQVTSLMDDDVSKFAQHGVATIRSLQILLQQEDSNSQLQDLSIKVPLLGDVRVRRNIRTLNPPNGRIANSVQNLQNGSSWRPDEQITSQPPGGQSDNTNAPVDFAFQPQGEWQWDPLSWSVDNYNENYFFQGTFMGENYDQFSEWQNI